MSNMTQYTRICSKTLLVSTLSTLCTISASGLAQTAAADAAVPPAAAEAPLLTQPEQGATAASKTQPLPAPETARAPISPTAPLATPAPLPAPTPAPIAAEPTKPSNAPFLAIGDGGGVKLSGLFQVWGVYQHQYNIDPPDDKASTLRIRRAEAKVSGDLVPKLFSFGVMFDLGKVPSFGSTTVVTPAPSGSTQTGTTSVLTPARDNSILQDFYITYTSPWFDLSAGQFKTPTSYESSRTSSGKLLFPERSLVSRTYGEQREMGIKAEKKFDYVGFVLGAYNGSGINRTDDNMQKDVALRLEVYPFKGLTLAGVGYTSVGQRATEASTKDRAEGDVVLQLGDFVAQGEYIHAWTGAKNARLEGAGWYGAVGYTFAKLIQPVVRVGQLDRDVNTSKNTASIIEAGVNWFAYKDLVKLQAAYAHTGYQAANTDALSEVVVSGQFMF